MREMINKSPEIKGRAINSCLTIGCLALALCGAYYSDKKISQAMSENYNKAEKNEQINQIIHEPIQEPISSIEPVDNTPEIVTNEIATNATDTTQLLEQPTINDDQLIADDTDNISSSTTDTETDTLNQLIPDNVEMSASVLSRLWFTETGCTTNTGDEVQIIEVDGVAVCLVGL